MTPDATAAASADDVLARFPADRRAYIRGHVTLAILAAVIGVAGFLLTGTKNLWVPVVAAALAMALRGGYLMSEELGLSWTLTPARLACNDGRSVALKDIDKVRRLGSAVQVVSRSGEKYLLKHLKYPDGVRAQIESARRAGKA